MEQEMLTKISEILQPDLIKSFSSEKDDVPMLDKIIQMIGLDNKGLSEKEIENIISNYVFISEKMRLEWKQSVEGMTNGAEYTAEALDSLITGLLDQGYEIVPVSQLIYKDNYHMDHTGRQISGSK